jgi:ATP-binding protein involved in chromosome partitioning
MFLIDHVNVPILGIVENMSWFTPKELPDNKYMIFGEGGGKKLAKLSKSVLLGQVPLVQGIREGGDSGKPVATQDGNPLKQRFEDLALNTIRQVQLRNEVLGPTTVVKMVN